MSHVSNEGEEEVCLELCIYLYQQFANSSKLSTLIWQEVKVIKKNQCTPPLPNLFIRQIVRNAD